MQFWETVELTFRRRPGVLLNCQIAAAMAHVSSMHTPYIRAVPGSSSAFLPALHPAFWQCNPTAPSAACLGCLQPSHHYGLFASSRVSSYSQVFCQLGPSIHTAHLSAELTLYKRQDVHAYFECPAEIKSIPKTKTQHQSEPTFNQLAIHGKIQVS